MKKLFSLLATTALLGFIATPADATLIDRGAGLIYDTDLNITWLQDANYAKTSGYDADGFMSWNESMAWAANLTYYDSIRGISYDDWRLPSNNLHEFGFGRTASEMGHLNYTELGNKGYYATNGVDHPDWSSYQSDWGLSNTGLFNNLQAYVYWSETIYSPQAPTYWNGTTYLPDTFYSWSFAFNNGDQYADHTIAAFAWAVRDGDIYTPAPVPTPTPEPSTLLLLGGGLAGLAVIRMRQSKKQG